MAQISNIEVADMNGLIECDSRAPLPLTYEPLLGHEIFKEPFLINGTDSLVVPQDDPYWITNIRKAVATLFTVNSLRKHEGEHDGLLQTQTFQEPAVVVDQEQSLAGTCQHRYVLTKLPDYLKEKHVEYIETIVKEDVQRDYGHVSGALKSKGSHGKGSKTSPGSIGKKGSKGSKGTYKGSKDGKLRADVPKLCDNVYVLSRTINFDECHTMVKFQNFGHGIYCEMGTSQCGTLLSRSSTGSFYLRGSPEALRIEKVEIEGNVLINPLGYETEKIRTITNQTLELRAVRFLRTPLTLPTSTRQVDSFMYEVESPVSSVRDAIHPSVHHQPMQKDKSHDFYPMYSVTGLAPSLIGLMQPVALDLIKHFLREMQTDLMKFKVGDEKHSNIAERMDTVVNMIKTLDYDQLKDLFNSFDIDDESKFFMREMLIDTMAKAGTDAAVRVLVEQIKSHAIGIERTAQVFMGLTNSLQMPEHSFPRLLELLKVLDMKEEFQVTSSLVLNMATAINRLCLAPRAHDTHQKLLLGHHYCNPRVILEQFLPIVEKGLQHDENIGHKMVYIHALTMMTTERKLPILKPIILGRTETDVRVRSLACYALQKCNTPASIVKEIYHLLMPVFEYQGEHHEVRMAAVGSLVTWKPDATWWHRLAVASWRDSSRQMQSYISHLIRSVAKRNGEKFDTLRQRATHVLPMTKYFPRSKYFSMPFLTGAYLEAIETGIVQNFEWVYAMKSYLPTHVYMIAITHQGSFLNMIFELILGGDVEGFLHTNNTLRYYPVIEETTATRRAKIMYKHALMALRMDEFTHFENLETPEDTDDEFILAARLFFNVQRVFMIDRDRLIKWFLLNPTWNLAKFMNPIEIFVSFPTDVGLPFVGTVTFPSVLYSNFEIGQPMPTLKLKNFMSVQVQTKAQVITPWNGQALTSGFKVREDYMLPLSAFISQNNFSLTITEDKKVSLLRRFNHPFTVRAPILPPSPLSELKDFKIIHINEKPFKDKLDLGKQYTGMALDLEWEGDVESSITLPSLIEAFSKEREEQFYTGLAPTLQHCELRISFDPEHSSTSIVKMSFTSTYTENKDTYSQFTQESQYDDIGQQTGDDYEFQEFQEFQESQKPDKDVETVAAIQYSVHDSDDERRAKMEQHHQQMNFRRVSSSSWKVEFGGSKVYKYEIVHTFANEHTLEDPTKPLYKLKLILLNGNDKTEDMICIDILNWFPKHSNWLDLPAIPDHDLKNKYSVEIREGENCSLAPVVEAEGFIDMTQHRKDIILALVESEDFCGKDPEVLEHIQPVYDDFYSHIKWNQDKLDCSPLIDLVYHVEDFVKGLLFPHVTHNYCHAKNTPGVVTINATRSIDTNLWSVWTHKPTQTSLFDHLRVPEFIDTLMLYDHEYRHTDRDIALHHDECHIYEDHIYTFDGMIYPLEKSLCWQVLAMDVDQHESWMLLQRYVEYPEKGTQLRFINPKNMIVADIMSGQVKVNGKPMIMDDDRWVFSHEDNTLCIVNKYKDQLYISFPFMLDVTLKDSHIVVKTHWYTTGGLCGARDGEVTGDLQGPNRCVYYKPELFVTSWTVGGDGGCDPYALEELIEKVEDYQQHCPKFHPQATGPAHDWHET